MLRAHVENGASCTIAAINVTMQEASRFGILNTREDGTIYEFEEKPKQPKSTLASMGIYIFTAQKLYDYLEEDDSNPSSSKDFGKDVLPAMLAAGEKMVAYSFDGYWKDVGTISSLWEANMDLLGDDPAFDVSNSDWKIHSRNPLAPPEYVGEDAIIKNSMIALGCEIEGTVINSLLSSNVIVKKGAFVKDSVIMSGTVIEEDARVTYAIIDEDVTVSRGAVIGEERTSKKGIAVLGRNIVVEEGAILPGGNIVDKNVLKGGK